MEGYSIYRALEAREQRVGVVWALAWLTAGGRVAPCKRNKFNCISREGTYELLYHFFSIQVVNLHIFFGGAADSDALGCVALAPHFTFQSHRTSEE